LTVAGADAKDRRRRVLALQSRHQLFPQVFRYVDDYVRCKVNFQNCEAPLMPITNRYKPIGTTAEVDFKTTRACHATMKSHIDQVVLDNLVWESSGAVQFYARNDHMGLTIPYEYMGIGHAYEPDFLVRLSNSVTVVLQHGDRADCERST
jgi:type III restriction enzyme